MNFNLKIKKIILKKNIKWSICISLLGLLLVFLPVKKQISATEQQDFNWGVLAINPHKSTYSLHEKASFSLAVLDEKGRMVCDAKLELRIKNQPLGINELLSTENGEIKTNPECKVYGLTKKPDFEAVYQTTMPGNYQIELTAITKNGRQTITDAFEVLEEHPQFDIEKNIATRIYPVETYPAKIIIFPHQDFQGQIIQEIPDSWQIPNSNSQKPLIWQVDWQKDQRYELNFEFKTPEISPEFYLLDPLKFINSKGQVVFEETRRWQIAVDNPELLTFSAKYVVASTAPTTTTSITLVDDTPASQTFNLTASKTVLVIYQANNIDGATMVGRGMQNAINIDSTDYANSWDSPYSTNYTTRNTTFWVGTLGSGNHTIKGRFASGTSGSTATISNRILLIMIFNGDEFQYVDDATMATHNTTTFIDDPNAQKTFTPSANCKALVLYNISNIYGSTESTAGKKAAINIGGVDYGQAEKSPYGTNYADSVFTAHALSLSAVSTTIKGRFAANAAATVTIQRRQLAVLLFADTTQLDINTSSVQVGTTSNSSVDDTQATLNRTTTDTRELLVVAVGTKRAATSSSTKGECYGIKIDTNDRTNSRGSPYGTTAANSAGTAYAETLTAGSHTVQGRFSNNSLATSAKIDARQVIALWLSGPMNISGTTNVTGGNVALAFNGNLQTGTTAPISSGTWQFTGISPLSAGTIITTWVTGAATGDKSTAVTEYDGSNDISNMVLNKHTLSVGSSGDNATVTVTNLGLYDYDQTTDIVHQANSSTLTLDPGTLFTDEKIDVLANNTLTIDNAEILNTHDLAINGTLTSVGNAAYNVSGSWDNNGTFTAGSSAVLFNATAGSEIIEAGSSSFYDIIFNSGTGGWTIQTNNLRTTRNFTVADVSSLIVEASRTIEVNGDYSIANAETSATTWNAGSVLYLNSGTDYTVGSKTQNAETYATLQIGANTDIRLWNSTATTFTVNASGSLYSQNHANTNGDLYIWGDYHTRTTDYWSYNTDFEGTDISGTPRQVDVRIDPSASVTVDSGDTLAVIGITGANRTSVSRQGAANGYGLASAGGTINFEYTDFDYLDGNKGLDIQTGSIVTSLSYTKFNNLIGTTNTDDAFITVATSVIGSGTKTITGVQFDNTGSGAEFNVNRTGSDNTGYWDFDASTGTFDGESYDAANGTNEADPGMLTWDDSNFNPTSPTSLLTEGLTNPVGVADTTPEFSAVYNDPNVADIANKYRIQVDDDSAFGSTLWDSGASGTTLTPNCTAGNRCTDISYGGAGTDLQWNTKYYWRIKFWDDSGAEGAWSTESAYFTMFPIYEPTSCMIDDSGQPNQLIIKWNDNTNLETGYRLERMVDGGNWTLLSTEAANTISKVDNVSSDPRHIFIYRIRANSDNGNSQWCSTPSVNYAIGNLQMKGVLVR